MLIEFKFKNFRSFKEETSLPMTSVKSFQEHQEHNLISTDNGFDLLKSAAIYGMNGSGKTNLILAMMEMDSMVHNSFSDSLKKGEAKPSFENTFRLSTETENANTLYEVSFLINDEIYRYGFEVNDQIVMKEWLYKKVEREKNLFLREENSFKINKSSFEEGMKYKDDVNPNVLFISHLAQFNQKIARTVFNWFGNLYTVSGLFDTDHETVTKRLIQKDENFKKWSSLVLNFLEITSIEAGELKGELVTYHNKYDANNLLIDSVPFGVTNDESAGTRKLIYLLGPIYVALKHGQILFIDEFDSKLHTNLSKGLIKLIHKFNINNAQIIFNGQDVNLLDKNLLRRDQIWFVDKDQFGVSELYSLSEFNSKTVRNTSAYYKKYLENKFGAAESWQLDDKLKALLYAE